MTFTKAGTIALLLSATVLGSFYDPNATANRTASLPSHDDVVVPYLPRGVAEQRLACIPVLELRQINDFLRRHGIPLILTARESATREPTQDRIAVCFRQRTWPGAELSH